MQLLQKGGADPQEVMLQKAKYQGQLNEYAVFSRKMGLKEERERIYIDGRGRVAPNTLMHYREDRKANKHIANTSNFGIIPSLTVGKIKMATNPVNMGSVAVFYFVTICAIL